MEQHNWGKSLRVNSLEDLPSRLNSDSPPSIAHIEQRRRSSRRIGFVFPFPREPLMVKHLLGRRSRSYPDNVSAGSQRRKELRRIRQIFIPDLVLRLHNLLISQRHHFPLLLQYALDLTKIVAAEEFHVYEEFFGRDDNPYRLIAYLERIREAGLGALEGGSGSAFVNF